MDAEDNNLVESISEVTGSEVKDTVSTREDSNPISENTIKDEKVSSDNTESKGMQHLSSNKSEGIQETTRSADQLFENGKRKVKEEKPPTKVVVRRLPPLMTKDTFLEQVSPLPPYDYMYFVSGDPSYGLHSFSRAYINFINQEDVFTFTRTFDNYVFLDAKGQEYPAIVEFSPFQRVPKQRSKKKDTLTGSIESDPMYLTFKENLLAEALENSKPGAKTMKQHYFETEICTTEEINTTPLLEFLKQKRAEKARIRDERREEKKRKEAERKLKHKTKDKKFDGEEEETAKDVKVLQSKERRDSKEKDLKATKKKEEKEKLLKENRTREFKNRSGKSYQEERIRQAERREERKKETNSVTLERKSESQGSDGKDAETLEDPSIQEEKCRLFMEKKRIYENKKKNDTDDWKIEGDVEKRIKTDRNRSERRQRERERKRREEFANRKGYEKKHSDSVDKRKTKTFKSSSSNFSNDSKNTTDKTKLTNETNETLSVVQTHRDPKETNKENKIIKNVINEGKHDKIVSQRRKSLESGDIIKDKIESTNSSTISKRRNSLESGNTSPEDNFKLAKSEKRKEHSKIENSEYNKELTKLSNDEIIKKSKQLNISENKTQQCKPQNIDHVKDESKISESNKNNDLKTKITEAASSADNSTRNKDPRSDRRIRNKDRPSLQIYRPGMGKFSKQRLEKEKVLGSSTEVESPSHSPSPTPKLKFPS